MIITMQIALIFQPMVSEWEGWRDGGCKRERKKEGAR